MFKFSIIFYLLIFISCHTSTNEGDQKPDINSEKFLIHKIMDDWHQAAANGNENIFFGSMSDSAIYLGTDKTERWTKSEFEAWSKKYVERDTAWSFTPHTREIYFSKNFQTAWFEELLDTWMGACRGSGVLTKKDSLWKLNHYNLSLLLDNDKIQKFIKINQKSNE